MTVITRGGTGDAGTAPPADLGADRTGGRGAALLAPLRDFARPRTAEAARAHVAYVAVTALAAVLYLWNLTANGYANTYYSAAALAASKSWSAWFFGSLDAGNFITVDKPPLSTMLMGLSVRLLGLDPLSILLPQALAGILTVALVMVAVRRSFGPLAAVIAGLVTALTPAAVLMFRFNNPDAILTLLMVAAALALLRALDDGSHRWVAVSGILVGFAFLAKYLEAYTVLPAFALVYAFAADAPLRRRFVGLLVAGLSVLAASGWWVAVVQAIPLGSRPFIGGSTTGSPLDLIFGYDGLGRIFGGTGPGGGGGANFGGVAGLLRLFNAEFFGQIAWLVPLAAGCLIVGLWLRRRALPTDRGLAGYLLWGGWFAVQAAVFSFMSGTIHTYYAVTLAPAIGALVGAGVSDLWALRSRAGGVAPTAAAVLLAGSFIGSAWWGWQLLARTPQFVPWLGPVAVGLAALSGAGLVLATLPRLRPRLGRIAGGALALGMCAVLLAPAAYAADTVQSSITGSDPHPGPTTDTAFGPGGAGFGGGFAGAFTGSGGALPGSAGGGSLPAAPSDESQAGAAPAGGTPAAGGPGASSGGGFGGDAGSVDSTLLQYLVANRGNSSWIVAVSSAQEAASIELATGLPVMGMGGFTGSDPAPTLAQLQAYVASGRLRYVLVGGRGFGGGFGGTGDAGSVDAWVTSTCTVVDSAGTASGSLYDCSTAVTK